MSKSSSAHIVVGVDGTPGSAGALRYAVQEAVLRGVGLRLVHVSPGYAPLAPMEVSLDPAIFAQAGREILDAAEHEVLETAPDVFVERHHAQGPRVSEIAKAVGDADLVVLGRETKHGMDRAVFGAVTAGVASRCTCPVVVVDAGWEPRPREADERGTLVVGIKTRDDADDLLSQAFAVATERHLDIVALHTWELADPYLDLIERTSHADRWKAESQELLEDVLAPWRDRFPFVKVEVRVEHGHASTRLVDAARKADLVMLLRSPGRIFRWHLGGTARAVLAGSPAPVHVVSAARPEHHRPVHQGEELLHSGPSAYPNGDWG
jgi:nucleotide-binding universal stress UspA family protein